MHIIKFLPALVLIAVTIFIGSQPKVVHRDHTDVLAYATSVGAGDLLAQTNSQRSSGGIGTLSLSGQLNAAAQAKANDMTARNYWSHTTPEGTQPWTFITNTGYQYSTAGENLAYGFATSSDTVTGWMNSPPHRENILNTSFTEVGFGIANSTNFNGDGEQTVVVAMYASPQSVQQATPVAAAPTQPPAVPKTPADTAPTPAQPTEPVAVPQEQTALTTTAKAQEITTDSSVKSASASPVTVRRVQLLTDGRAAWSATVVVVSVCSIGVLWALQRGLKLKRLMLAGERYFLHHIHMDITMAAIIALGIVLLSTTGTIR